MSVAVTVHGTPAPQGSKRHVGRGVMVESSARVKPWREAVKAAVLDHTGIAAPLTGPLWVDATFVLPKPRSAPKTRRTWPHRRPDLDKLLRSTFDALGDAGVWIDDAQVIEVTARKVYVGPETDTLPHPGAVVQVGEWAANEVAR